MVKTRASGEMHTTSSVPLPALTGRKGSKSWVADGTARLKVRLATMHTNWRAQGIDKHHDPAL